jgi:peptide/nickel transport system substrate-binding protein
MGQTVAVPQHRQGTRRFLATVLFTDIVGSTERAAQLGDRAWRDVLERHNAIVRRELRAYNGREMDTAGDGFFAVFETPERAVRCAEAITSAVRSLDIEVRAGVHTGECEVMGGKVAGMTVVIGARIAALAEAGQVLVSGSVRDLMTGSGRHFEGGDARTLKGVEDQWRVYRLVPEVLDGDAGPTRRQSLVPLYTRHQRRRLLALLTAAVVVVVSVSTGYVLTRSEADVVIGENAVGVIGPGDTPKISAAAHVGHRPTAVAAGFGSVWVTNSTDGSVSRIDRRTKVSVPISVGASPSGVAVGAGAVWVANSGDGTVSRIDPTNPRPTTIQVDPGPTGVVVAFGSVWVTNALDAKVTEIDPDTNKVVHVLPVGASPTGIAAGAGYLWVTNQGDGTVTRFRPGTHELDPPVTVGSRPVGIVFADGAAWVANNLDGSLSRIDADDLTVTSRILAKGGGAYGVAAHGNDVWVSNEYAGSLMRVNRRTFQLAATVRLRGAPLGLGFAGDDLWFTSAEGGSALHRGGILTIASVGILGPGDDPPVLDPLIEYIGDFWRLATMTNDGLVGLLRAGGVQGAGFVPDLATTLPKPTGDGLIYTFHLRKGVRYSTGAPVLAGDIRRGIERAVAHPDSAPSYYAGAIVGAQACRTAAERALGAGKPRPDCDLSRGIVADDRNGTVTFHLRKPTPEFVFQLSLPSTAAVPQDTPLDLKPGQFLPATGPYMVHSYIPQQEAAGVHGRLELVRNPHFRVWSPAAQPAGYVDRIVLETGFTEQEEVARVTDGRADLLWLGAPPSAMDMIRARYASQLHVTAGIYTDFAFLNASKPPFDNLDARRAVAYALDRKALTNDRDGLPARVTCQLLPPNFAAYRSYCPFTVGGGTDGKWAGPDIPKARELVRKSGTKGAKVVVAAPEAVEWRRAGRRIRDVLDDLGYDASLRVLGYPDEFFQVVTNPREDFNAGLSTWGSDYPAASTFLAIFGSCKPDLTSNNYSAYCDQAIEGQIQAALDLQVTDPGRANDVWAVVDRRMVDAAAFIPFGAEETQNFVSRRVGNTLVHPIHGPLIAQMWVQ